MTWSILARDARRAHSASPSPAASSPSARSASTRRRGVGALATQALVNPLYGAAGLALLGEGSAAGEVIAAPDRRRRRAATRASST